MVYHSAVLGVLTNVSQLDGFVEYHWLMFKKIGWKHRYSRIIGPNKYIIPEGCKRDEAIVVSGISSASSNASESNISTMI